MAITAAGVGSGIDIENILSQLAEIERRPVDALNRKREALDVELSAYGTAKSALNSFQTAAEELNANGDFGAFVASSSDEEVFTATANNGNTAERHDVEVVSLATNHRLASGSYESASASIEEGTLTFTAGENTFDVVIDNTNATLSGLRDAINAETSNSSISASILNVDGGSRLVLTANASGTEGQINVTRSNVLPVDSPADFSEVTEAVDAKLIVHGFEVTSSSNNVSGVIDGVTLNLTGEGKATVNSERDFTSLRESLDEFVEKYNAMSATMSNLGKTDLSGDQLPRGFDTQVRQMFLEPIDLSDGDSTTALELGFTFDRYGKLSIDTDKYENALEQGVDRYVRAFTTNEIGLSSAFSSLVDEYVQAGGIIDTREDGVDSRRDTIDSQIERLEYRIEKTNLRMRQQFTAMDLAVTELQNTSGFLASRLGNNILG
ncbi:MAG: flagellar filament capping protein FliD [Granulosicoccus sp.]